MTFFPKGTEVRVSYYTRNDVNTDVWMPHASDLTHLTRNVQLSILEECHLSNLDYVRVFNKLTGNTRPIKSMWVYPAQFQQRAISTVIWYLAILE